MTNRKSYMRFRLIPKSMTLDKSKIPRKLEPIAVQGHPRSSDVTMSIAGFLPNIGVAGEGQESIGRAPKTKRNRETGTMTFAGMFSGLLARPKCI